MVFCTKPMRQIDKKMQLLLEEIITEEKKTEVHLAKLLVKFYIENIWSN